MFTTPIIKDDFRDLIASIVSKSAPRGDDGQDARRMYLHAALATFVPEALEGFAAEWAAAAGNTVNEDRVIGTYGQYILDLTD